MLLGRTRRNRFPSVLLQPLGHLSVSFESAVYRLVAEPANPNCDTDCDRPPNVPRSPMAIWSSLSWLAREQHNRPNSSFQYRTRRVTPTLRLGIFERDYTAQPSFLGRRKSRVLRRNMSVAELLTSAAAASGVVVRRSTRRVHAVQESGAAAQVAQLLVEGKMSNDTFEEWNRETGGKNLPEHVTRAAKKSGGRQKSVRRRTSSTKR